MATTGEENGLLKDFEDLIAQIGQEVTKRVAQDVVLEDLRTTKGSLESLAKKAPVILSDIREAGNVSQDVLQQLQHEKNELSKELTSIKDIAGKQRAEYEGFSKFLQKTQSVMENSLMRIGDAAVVDLRKAIIKIEQDLQKNSKNLQQQQKNVIQEFIQAQIEESNKISQEQNDRITQQTQTIHEEMERLREEMLDLLKQEQEQAMNELCKILQEQNSRITQQAQTFQTGTEHLREMLQYLRERQENTASELQAGREEILHVLEEQEKQQKSALAACRQELTEQQKEILQTVESVVHQVVLGQEAQNNAVDAMQESLRSEVRNMSTMLMKQITDVRQEMLGQQVKDTRSTRRWQYVLAAASIVNGLLLVVVLVHMFAGQGN